ncbi:MAG: substrate-binding domain-containing protein [bacterium]|nr:substrate-binding domain-containing protein [bacterium]
MNGIPRSIVSGVFCCAAVLFAALSWMGCGAQPDRENGASLTIGMVPKSTAHVFWKTVHAGALAAAKEANAELIWIGPPTETEKDQQVAIVDDLITKRVDGVALAPQDQEALVPAVERVAAAGIPCVIFDSGLSSDKYASFVGTDNYLGGVKAAHEMARLLNNKGGVIIVGAHPGSESNTQRERGFEETLAKEYPDIHVIDKQYGYSDREKSRAVTEDMLTAHPDVDAVFGPNEPCIFGALLALQARRMAGSKTVVGFDSSDELIDAMKTGEVHALILQNPYRMGYMAIQTMIEAIHGETTPKRIDTGVYVATPDNLEEADIQQLLHPDLKGDL